MIIDKKTLEKIAELARMEIDEKDEKKLLKDLEKILEHFNELKELNTEGVKPMNGGTNAENVFREDETNNKHQITDNKLIGQFPEEKDGFLKVPPVFE